MIAIFCRCVVYIQSKCLLIRNENLISTNYLSSKPQIRPGLPVQFFGYGIPYKEGGGRKMERQRTFEKNVHHNMLLKLNPPSK